MKGSICLLICLIGFACNKDKPDNYLRVKVLGVGCCRETRIEFLEPIEKLKGLGLDTTLASVAKIPTGFVRVDSVFEITVRKYRSTDEAPCIPTCYSLALWMYTPQLTCKSARPL